MNNKKLAIVQKTDVFGLGPALVMGLRRIYLINRFRDTNNIQIPLTFQSAYDLIPVVLLLRLPVLES